MAQSQRSSVPPVSSPRRSCGQDCLCGTGERLQQGRELCVLALRLTQRSAVATIERRSHVVTSCGTEPTLQDPLRDPARFEWHEVQKIDHYWLEVNAMTHPMQIREEAPPYGREHDT